MNWHTLLAQTSQPAPTTTDFLFGTVGPLVAMIIVFYWLLYRGQRKDKKKVEDMLSNLKRNDRVLTIGGILATVVDVRENEVVLKVDETSNVKMRFLRSAIKEVLVDQPAKPA